VDSRLEPGPDPGCLLLAPLGNRERRLAVLALAAQSRDSLLEFERDLVSRIAPLASAAILRSRDLHYVQERMVNAERRQVLSDLAAGVAHDINNQLGSLIPTVESLLRDLQDGQADGSLVVDDLTSIRESARACARIVRSMLAHARGARSDAGPAHVRIAVDRVLALVREGLDREGIELLLEMEDDLPAVPGAQSDLDRLMSNLVLNARDAMVEGGRLRITAEHAGDTVRVVVEDSGHGIPTEDQSRIFEPFFTTKPNGTGLGLGVVRRVVDDLNGSIRFRSVPGEGTSFEVTLPADA
jgi:signal transduction histidine kinase